MSIKHCAVKRRFPISTVKRDVRIHIDAQLMLGWVSAAGHVVNRGQRLKLANRNSRLQDPPSCLRVHRGRRRFCPSCIATWRFTGRCTMRRSGPQRCLPLLRTTGCCLSRSCSSCSEGPRWDLAALDRSPCVFPEVNRLVSFQLFVGFGFPYEGPAPLEAVANGCIFLQPKFNPPRSSLNHEFFRGKPTSREVRSPPATYSSTWQLTTFPLRDVSFHELITFWIHILQCTWSTRHRLICTWFAVKPLIRSASLRCPLSIHTRRRISAGRTSSPSTSITLTSSTQPFEKSWRLTWVNFIWLHVCLINGLISQHREMHFTLRGEA